MNNLKKVLLAGIGLTAMTVDKGLIVLSKNWLKRAV